VIPKEVLHVFLGSTRDMDYEIMHTDNHIKTNQIFPYKINNYRQQNKTGNLL